MIQRIEHLHAELQLPLFVDWESLDDSQIDVPVTRGRKDVPARALLARCRKTKGLGKIDATGGQCYGLEENRTRECLTRQLL